MAGPLHFDLRDPPDVFPALDEDDTGLGEEPPRQPGRFDRRPVADRRPALGRDHAHPVGACAAEVRESFPSVSSEKPCEQRLTAATHDPLPLSSWMSRTTSRVLPLSEKPTTATIFIVF